jgi:hypothetical protein
MSLLFIDGFDAYGTDGENIVNLLNSSGYACAADFSGQQASVNTRTGVGFSMNQSSGLYRTYLPFKTSAAVVIGFAISIQAAPSGCQAICSLEYNNLLGRIWDQLILLYDGQNGISLVTADNDLVGASNPNVLFVDTWQYVEIMYAPGLTAGSVQVKVDGAVVINVPGGKTSCSAAPALVNQFVFGGRPPGGGAFTGATGVNALFDDFYLCDQTGSAFNTFLGDCVVHSVFPNADAGTNMMAQTGGGAGHFTSVDEQSPDGDVSYLSTNQVAQKELFTLGAFPTDMVDILAIAVNIRARKDAAGTGMYQASMAHGGVEVDGPEIAAAANYVTSQTLYTAPPDGGVWTKAAGQASEIGFVTA